MPTLSNSKFNLKMTCFQWRKSVGPILWHCRDFNNQTTHHQFCPQGSDNWCKYQKYQSIDGSPTYKEPNNNPTSIFEIVHFIFVSLSSDDLLKKYLHHQSQNSNDLFNNVIWTKRLKAV